MDLNAISLSAPKRRTLAAYASAVKNAGGVVLL
jgi:hypothetical protein